MAASFGCYFGCCCWVLNFRLLLGYHSRFCLFRSRVHETTPPPGPDSPPRLCLFRFRLQEPVPIPSPTPPADGVSDSACCCRTGCRLQESFSIPPADAEPDAACRCRSRLFRFRLFPSQSAAVFVRLAVRLPLSASIYAAVGVEKGSFW